MRNKFTPSLITELKPNEVFVFGSNIEGYHMGGAAEFALDNFGAVYGKGDGHYGQSYAIPTMEGDINYIKTYVDKFIAYAKAHKDLIFYVTPIGCGIADFTPEEIAPLFNVALDMENVILPESFVNVLIHKD